MAEDFKVTPVSESFHDHVAAISTVNEDSDNNDFKRVLNDQFKIDEALRFLEEHTSVAQYTENNLRKLMFRHPETGKLHLEPKNKLEALQDSNSDRPVWQKAMGQPWCCNKIFK